VGTDTLCATYSATNVVSKTTDHYSYCSSVILLVKYVPQLYVTIATLISINL